MIIKDNTPQVLSKLDKAVEAGLVACCIELENRIVTIMTQEKIVDTGRLRGSITWKTPFMRSKTRGPAKDGDGVRSTPQKNEAYVGTNVEYAPYVEYGVSAKGERSSLKTRKTFKATKGMRARPYLRRGLDETRSALPKIFQLYFDKTFTGK